MRLPRILTPAYRGQRPLRPAVRRLRPGPGPDRGRVGQGDLREVPGQHRPGVPHPRHHHQGAARRAGQAPPVGAVDRLLQAAALREVPEPAPAVQRGHQARRRRRRQGLAPTRPRPTSCSRRSTRSPRSSGRPSRRDPRRRHRRSGRHVPRTCRPSSRWCTSWPSTSGPPSSATSPTSSCTRRPVRPARRRCSATSRSDAADEPLGFALWFLNFSTWAGVHGIYLEDLYVRPAARGTGAGRLLLATLAAICVERGYRRLDWWMIDWNPAAGFYAAIGADADGRVGAVPARPGRRCTTSPHRRPAVAHATRPPDRVESAHRGDEA